MHSILDHTLDLTGSERHRLTQTFTPPAYVKQASHTQLNGDEEGLASHLFADATARLYPCHTKAATWMSALFFQDKQAELGERKIAIEQRILKSADYFQIRSDVDQLWQKMAHSEKQAAARLADADFAFVWVGTDGSKERRYPLRNAAEVKMAAAWFNQHADHFNFQDRHVMAQRITEKATAYNAQLDDTTRLYQSAGLGFSPSAEVAEAFTKRAKLVRRQNPALAEQTEKTAELIAERRIGVFDMDLRTKLASLLDQFDAEANLKSLYDDGLERPEEVLFKLTHKTASDMTNSLVSLINGYVYEKQAMGQLQLDQVRTWMGDDICDAVNIGDLVVDVEKLAELLPTLPRPDADKFTMLADCVGIPAFAMDKQASATPAVQQVRQFVDAYSPAT